MSVQDAPRSANWLGSKDSAKTDGLPVWAKELRYTKPDGTEASTYKYAHIPLADFEAHHWVAGAALYELLPAGKPCFGYLDIEWYQGGDQPLAKDGIPDDQLLAPFKFLPIARDGILEELLATFHAEYGADGFVLCDCDVIILSSHGYTRDRVLKFSFHFIFKPRYQDTHELAVFANVQQAGAFRAKLEERLRAHGLPSTDPSVYASDRLMRIYKASKACETRKFVCDSGVELRLVDTMIAACVTDQMRKLPFLDVLVAPTTTGSRSASGRSSAGRGVKARNVPIPGGANLSSLNHVIQSRVPGATLDPLHPDSFWCPDKLTAQLYAPGFRWCPENNAQHQRNRVLLCLDLKAHAWHYFCFDCGPQRRYRGKLQQELIDSFIFPTWVRSTIDLPYLTDRAIDGGCLPHPTLPIAFRGLDVARGSLTTLAISSPKGTGKTELVRWLIRRDQLPEGAIVLAVSPLRSLTRNLSTKYDLELYDDEPAGKPIPIGHERPRWVTTPESLLRFTSRNRGGMIFGNVDVFVLDELEATLANFRSKTITGNRDRMQIWRDFVSLVKRSQIVLVADADLGPRAEWFLRAFRPEPSVQFLRNKFEPAAFNYRQVTHSTDLLLLADRLIRDGKKVAIASNSRAWIEDSVVPVLNEIGHHSRLIIHAKTVANQDESAFLADPSALVTKYDVLVFSPSMCSGFDINPKEPHFDVILVHGVPSTTAAALLQQAGRVRKAVSGFVYMFLDHKEQALAFSTNLEDLERALIIRRDDVSEEALIHVLLNNDEDEPRPVDQEYLTLTALNIAERHETLQSLRRAVERHLGGEIRLHEEEYFTREQRAGIEAVIERAAQDSRAGKLQELCRAIDSAQELDKAAYQRMQREERDARDDAAILRYDGERRWRARDRGLPVFPSNLDLCVFARVYGQVPPDQKKKVDRDLHEQQALFELCFLDRAFVASFASQERIRMYDVVHEVLRIFNLPGLGSFFSFSWAPEFSPKRYAIETDQINEGLRDRLNVAFQHPSITWNATWDPIVSPKGYPKFQYYVKVLGHVLKRVRMGLVTTRKNRSTRISAVRSKLTVSALDPVLFRRALDDARERCLCQMEKPESQFQFDLARAVLEATTPMLRCIKSVGPVKVIEQDYSICCDLVSGNTDPWPQLGSIVCQDKLPVKGLVHLARIIATVAAPKQVGVAVQDEWTVIYLNKLLFVRGPKDAKWTFRVSGEGEDAVALVRESLYVAFRQALVSANGQQVGYDWQAQLFQPQR